METWEAAYEGRDDLKAYGNNGLLLFALALHQDIDDIELAANDVLTDGHNDKKCDLIYVDREAGKIIIAQGYYSDNHPEKEAPSNKASDLNTAAAWVFSEGYENTPDAVRSAAEQIHDALASNEISSIEFWYVHNRTESKNVQEEMDKVAQTVAALVHKYHPQANIDSIQSTEIGRNTLDTWYQGIQAPILVTETFEFETRGGFSSSGDTWEAYSTSVPAAWLREKYQEYGRALFSANVRDYLGSRKSDKNINNNIKQTASNNPTMFWVYNNGITALVNDFTFSSEDDSGMLAVSGIAIVNGAQTTGALGSVDDSDLAGAMVPARFVKCSDPDTIQDIIRYTNSQNRIEAADFRSNDRVQTRLRAEFEEIPEADYSGGRRGGAEDAIRRPRTDLSSYTVGQSLMAFHGEPSVAYNQRSNIWQSDSLYTKIFNDAVTAEHIVCAMSLLQCIEHAKKNLRSIPDDKKTAAQKRQWEVLRQRGATFLTVSAIASSIDTIVDKPIHDNFHIKFREKINPSQATERWQPVIDVCLPLITQLAPALEGSNLKNKDAVQEAVNQFVDMLGAVRDANAATFDAFGEVLVC